MIIDFPLGGLEGKLGKTWAFAVKFFFCDLRWLLEWDEWVR